MLDPKLLKKDFPIFKAHPGLTYLDSAATELKPRQVLEAEMEYYTSYSSNVHRGLYSMSIEATKQYEAAREEVAKFIHAPTPHEIIFTSGATSGINIVAQGFAKQFLHRGDEIIVTLLEHHSNFVPWQAAAKKLGLKIKFWDIKDSGELDEKAFNTLLTPQTRLLAGTHISNALGTINPLKKIIQKAHASKAKVLVDAAQSIAHIPLDAAYLDCDFLVFSGHKMFGPTGIGILYAKDRILQTMEPFFYGGDMIREVHKEYSTWNDLPWKFEAGTPNIAGAIGLSRAIKYLKEIGMAQIQEHEKKLLAYAVSELKKFPSIKLFGPLDPEKQSSILSFGMEGIHPHDIASLLDQQNIAIRAGHHCSMPLMTRLKIPATARISFSIYNTEEDIDRLISALKKIHTLFYAPNGKRSLHRPHHRSLQKSAQQS